MTAVLVFMKAAALLAVVAQFAPGATLQQLQQDALRTSPDIASRVRQLEAARAAGQQAGRWANPELSISADRDEQKIGITQSLDLWGKLAVARRVAFTQADVASARMASARLDLLSEVARQFWTLAAAERRAALVDGEVASWEKLLRIRHEEVTAGEIAPADLLTVQNLVTERRQDRWRLRAEITAAQAALKTLTGRKLDEALAIDVPRQLADSPPRVGDVRGAMQEALGRHPLLVQARARLEAAGFRVRQEERRWAPDPKAGPFIRRSDDSTFVGIALSFSVPVVDRNRDGIRAAAEYAAAAEADLRGAELTVAQEAFTAFELLAQFRESFAETSKSVQVSSARQMQLAEESFAAGAISERELLTARIEWNRREQAFEILKAQVGLAEARLARALAEETREGSHGH